MDICFVANDTRGGVEPYLALAAEATARGHSVRAVAPPQYEPKFRAISARFIPLRGADQAQQIASEGRLSLREMGRKVVELTARWAEDAASGAAGTDLVVSGIGGMSVARPVAQTIGAALLRAHLQPLEAPSSSYPGPLAAGLDRLGPVGRRFSHTLTAAGVSLLSGGPERAARARSTGCAAHRGQRCRRSLRVQQGSRSRRLRRRDHTDRPGYWTLPTPSDIDPALRRFLDRPGPVVTVGFGSMTTSDPAAFRDSSPAPPVRGGKSRAAHRVGRVADTPESNAEDVYVGASAPHSWLFTRVAATVHHGGAGTTGAALSAGKPTVIIPFGADQPFWANRAHRLGVAPPALKRSG